LTKNLEPSPPVSKPPFTLEARSTIRAYSERRSGGRVGAPPRPTGGAETLADVEAAAAAPDWAVAGRTGAGLGSASTATTAGREIGTFKATFVGPRLIVGRTNAAGAGAAGVLVDSSGCAPVQDETPVFILK
jgi:hypothetical protein